jgi:hypothetical protein
MAETERDEKVTRAYRALGGEEPPSALDEAILARARRSPMHWRVPLSIAAVLVLAVGVVLRVQHERTEAESVALAPQVMETPRPAAKPAAVPAAVERARRAEEATADAARREAPAGVVGEARVRALASAPITPEAWLERIAELRKQGRTREAEESLAEFKKRYPDYKIPEALR